ncbi:cobalt-precorrin 5A hydrolase [Lachnobacterium bovis]|uniref:Cobalt-precorrin 5A hydrolase n=1 Tax=Lachnobacterium bovis TaxID=140626 RepID=A0A1H9QA99_9FIRM|nr:cobalamin biosynthesis protein [Lachnobacterium bovis]SER57085.1 cobalt-precorrin 5A hydrolase [Lachnobacterium bovis]
MNISIISFTTKGAKLSKILFNRLDNYEVKCFSKKKAYEGIYYVGDSLTEWVRKEFKKHHAIIFIGACGIAVRVIAPSLKNKLVDSAVINIDENGEFVIPLLSGHYGGANELAVFIAAKIRAIPVITTATDVSDKFAIDIFAKKNNLFIGNKYGIAQVSAKVLDGQPITMSIEKGHSFFIDEHEISIKNTIIQLKKFPPTETVDVIIADSRNPFLLNNQINASLYLYPKKYVIGIGCKKGKKAHEIEQHIIKVLEQEKIDIEDCIAITSVDIKKDEEGIIEFSEKYNIPFKTYDVETLRKQKGDFEESEFVKETIGVGNVCETSALAYVNSEFFGEKNNSEIICHKVANNGVTVAIIQRDWRINIDD